jgi:two-component system, OmpR family, response regulator
LRVLAVDDDRNILELLGRVLAPEGVDLDPVETGREAVDLAMDGRYAVILLDAVLPDLPGLDVARALRAGGCSTPILMLTGLRGTDFLVEALDAGADDFLTKPFRAKELAARVRALSRRGMVVPTVTVGRITIDPLERTLTTGDRTIRLTGVELRLILELASAPGDFMTREHLLSAVWRIDFDTGTNLVYTHINNIRGKLLEQGIEGIIETSRGQGYRLDVH